MTVKTIAMCMLLSVAACGAPAAQSDTLNETIRGYNEAVRWERFENAATALPAAQRAQTVDDWDERAHDLKITEYDIVKIDSKGPHEARAQIKMSWYKSSEGTLRETQAIQTWEKHGKAWMMVDERRLRGHEMPGLPEPLDKDDRSGGAEVTEKANDKATEASAAKPAAKRQEKALDPAP